MNGSIAAFFCRGVNIVEFIPYSMIILQHLFLYSKWLSFILVLRLCCSSSFSIRLSIDAYVRFVVYGYCITTQNPSSFVIVARNGSFGGRFCSWDRVRIPKGCCHCSLDRVRRPEDAAAGIKAALEIRAANGFAGFGLLLLVAVVFPPPSVPSANPAMERSNEAISPCISDNDLISLWLYEQSIEPPYWAHFLQISPLAVIPYVTSSRLSVMDTWSSCSGSCCGGFLLLVFFFIVWFITGSETRIRWTIMCVTSFCSLGKFLLWGLLRRKE